MKILSILLILPSLLIANIFETPRMAEILSYLNHSPDKLLVVCDIDNTLIKPNQFLGSVAWGEHVVAQLTNKGIDSKKAHEIEHILWETLQPHLMVETIDSETSQVIQEIQKRNIPIIALTARFPTESNYTCAQLQSVGIDFSQQKHLSPSQQFLPTEPSALYQDGVLFGTTKNKKSDVLFAFLDHASLSPECVIFVDDKQYHVEDVIHACQKRGIRCIGIRFSGADEDVNKFNPAIAEAQWKAFPAILSNGDALQMISNQ